MGFDSNSGTLSCDSCGHQDNIEQLPAELITEIDAEEDVKEVFAEGEAKEYSCNNCGAIVITDADTTATSCSFCGAGVVLGDRLSGNLKPAQVIPFTISKEQAKEAFKKWSKKGRLAPSDFKEANRIKEITGIYVPFWMYDLGNKAIVDARATRVRTYSRGDYNYTETKHYDVYRNINIEFLKVPVDASEKMDDVLMDKLEPYDYSNLKTFKTPYLAGYLAEKYNYDDKELFPRVKEKVKNHINTYISSTVKGYTSVNYRTKQVSTERSKSHYVLLPVWMVYYDYDKSEHTFAMNGQTGKIVGKPPLSYGKAGLWLGGIAGGTFLISRVITMLLGGGIL